MTKAKVAKKATPKFKTLFIAIGKASYGGGYAVYQGDSKNSAIEEFSYDNGMPPTSILEVTVPSKAVEYDIPVVKVSVNA